jgi:hypothetical protein
MKSAVEKNQHCQPYGWAKIGCVAAVFPSAKEKIAGMMKFVSACDITIPA